MSCLGSASGMLRAFADKESMLVAADYSLMASGIATVIIVIVFSLGGDIPTMYALDAASVDSAL